MKIRKATFSKRIGILKYTHIRNVAFFLHILWKQSYFLNVVFFSCSWRKILRKYCQKLSTRYNLQTTMTGWSQKSLKGQTNTYSVFSPFSLEYKKKCLSDTSNIYLIQILQSICCLCILHFLKLKPLHYLHSLHCYFEGYQTLNETIETCIYPVI